MALVAFSTTSPITVTKIINLDVLAISRAGHCLSCLSSVSEGPDSTFVNVISWMSYLLWDTFFIFIYLLQCFAAPGAHYVKEAGMGVAEKI